jgi:hypothetical protein
MNTLQMCIVVLWGYLAVGGAIVLVGRSAWGPAANPRKYIEVVFLWPALLYLAARGKIGN